MAAVVHYLWPALGLLTALGCALIGGVFFAFSTFVMPALNERPPAEAVAAMQSINVVVLQSMFIPVMQGTALLCVVLAALTPFLRGSLETGLTIGGAFLYLLGTLAVTVARNIPLNDALVAVNSSGPDAPDFWRRYYRDWTRWNHVRTLAALAASALFMQTL
jgi:uncharacterized membrane protein